MKSDDSTGGEWEEEGVEDNLLVCARNKFHCVLHSRVTTVSSNTQGYE